MKSQAWVGFIGLPVALCLPFPARNLKVDDDLFAEGAPEEVLAELIPEQLISSPEALGKPIDWPDNLPYQNEPTR